MLADDAAADLMKHLAWHPPAIEQRVAGNRGRIEEVRRTLIQDVAAAEQMFEEWKAGGDVLRETMWTSFTRRPGVDTLPSLDRMISAVESKVETEVTLAARQRKETGRTLKDVARLAPEAYPLFEEARRRRLALIDAEIREKLDFALFLRALKSEVSALKAGGRKIVEFDADAYLRSLAAG